MGSLLLGAFGWLAAAQAPAATVAGSVRDDVTGKPLANAVVALPDLNRLVVTGPDGRYVVAQVPAGPQHVLVRYLGYTPRTLHALVPPAGRLEINVSLHPDPLRLPAIEVRPHVSVRGLDSRSGLSAPDRAASLTAVQNHPLLAEPDVFQALSGGEVGVRPESPAGVHIRGGAADQTGYLLDGIPVLSPYHAAALFSAWNPDAVAQVELWSTVSSPAYPDMLSGTIAATTRAPGSRVQVQGGASTTQTRVTIDGPAGSGGAGYLLSLRSAYPGVIGAKDEASYLGGESGDWLAKLEAPLGQGRVRLLGYGNGNEINSAARASAGDVPGENPRNSFEWSSRSLGAEWSRVVRRSTIRLTAWTASGDAKSTWAAETGRAGLGWSRRDQGLMAAVDHNSAGSFATLGFRVQRSQTRYQVASDSSEDVSLDARTPLAAGFVQYMRSISRVTVTVGASLAETGGTFYPSPAVQLRWQPAAQIGLSGSLARSHQFAQSLRNPESVVGAVFPVDLYLGAGAPGIPVARNDQLVIAADLRPGSGIRLVAQAYQRALDGLVLVAPGTGEPFSLDRFDVGSGNARGLSLDASLSAARYGVVASYGVQRVRFSTDATAFIPEHGATQLLEGGVIVFPTATSSIRLGAVGAFGRRATAVTGGLEFESCNLLDRGCEFGGSPRADRNGLGGTPLPAYVRVDLGLRKHWHLSLAGRDASVALFGTVTNLLGRKNLLSLGRDPLVDGLFEVEMRPRAPLVVGLDWRF